MWTIINYNTKIFNWMQNGKFKNYECFNCAVNILYYNNDEGAWYGKLFEAIFLNIIVYYKKVTQETIIIIWAGKICLTAK
jgi:hypothetical protein